ncbi:MAG: hypothetical protein M1835_006224 [Candelina submexicana]|nr:MAG: hypothetical protein M1835_006224 [Candelina submexicana]
MWCTFSKDLEKYGISFRPLSFTYDDEDLVKVANFRKFDLQLQPIRDDRLLIAKTDAELEILAEHGADLIINKDTEATCAHWIFKLLPLVPTSAPIFCRSSDVLRPGIIPEAEDDMPEAPWSRMKPDSVWFYTRGSLNKPAWDTLQKTLARDCKLKSGAIALNAELKASGGSMTAAQSQAVATAMVALGERIKIRQTAQGNVDELLQYFFIFAPDDIQLWRLVKTDILAFEAWQLDLGGRISFSAVEGIKRFIVVWNKLISNLTGPVLQSLKADLNKIADALNHNTRTTQKRRTWEDETVPANKKRRRSSRQRQTQHKGV